MESYLKKLPKELKEVVYLARDISGRLNMPAYLVGGFVRDLILGRNNFDLDIVIEGDGIRFASALAAALKTRVTSHARFKTATIHYRPHLKIDVSTARKERYPGAAQLPVVEAGTMKDDLLRRDFTVNSMAMGISCGHFGKLIDYFSGKDDLKRRLIRVMHDKSFIDDPCRILRAIRFEQRFGFKIEPHTLCLLKDAVNSGMLQKLQPQRLRDDLILILKEEDPARYLKRLGELTGFGFISHRIRSLRGIFSFLRALKKEITWFRKNLPRRRGLDVWLVYLMGLLSPLDRQDISKICRAMALRSGEEKRLLNCKQMPSKFISELKKPGLKPAKIYEMLEPLSYEVIVYIKASHKNPVLHGNINDFLRLYNGTRIALSGDDLLSMGILPGPDYRQILKKVLYAKLNGLIHSRQDEELYVKELIRQR